MKSQKITIKQILKYYYFNWVSQVALVVKNNLPVQEM